MNNTLWIENLDSGEDRRALARLFAHIGPVRDAAVVIDRDLLRRSGGTGRVEMRSSAAATAAIKALNGSVYHGLQISVRRARPSEIHRSSRRASTPVFTERSHAPDSPHA